MREILFLFVIVSVTMTAVQATAQFNPESQIAQENQKPTIAITTFKHLSAYPENGWVAMSFSESLTVKLKRLYERFHVVERLRVYDVARERGLDPEDIPSAPPQQQREIGSMLGASYLIVGSVSLQGLADQPTTPVLANMRTVDVRTGEVQEATSVSGQMQEIFDLEIQLAFAFLKQIGVDITQAEQQQISIKETESLLAEKYYNLGNQHFYDGNLEAAEVWYKKAVDLTEGGYHREAALRWVEVLKGQKEGAHTEADARAVHDKAGQRIEVIETRQAQANEMYYEKAELHMLREEYRRAIAAYQSYVERVLPWQQVKWRAKSDTGDVVVDKENVYIYDVSLHQKQHGDRSVYQLSNLTKESGALQWKFERGFVWQPEVRDLFPPSPRVVSTKGFVYFQVGTVLYALDRETGSEHWKFEAGQDRKAPHQQVRTFMFVGGSVYFRAETGMLYALAADTGRLKWQLDTTGSSMEESYLRAPPVLADGVIYTNGYETDVRFSALEAETGKLLWSAPLLVAAVSRPIIQSGIVYVPARGGIYALSAESGKIKWQSDSFEPLGIAWGDNTLYLLTADHDLVALNAGTGKIQWRRERIGAWRVTTGDGLLLCQAPRKLSALSAETGEIQWEFEGQFHPKVRVQEGTVYLLSGNSFYALSHSTGEIQWQFTGVRFLMGYDVTADGTVYISSAEEGLFALNPKPAGAAPPADQADVLVGLGRARRLMGEYDDAVNQLEAALESRVHFIKAHQELALCYEAMENWSQVTRAWYQYLAASIHQGVTISNETHRHLWELTGVRWVGPGRSGAQVIVTGNTIYVPGGDLYIYALDRETGEIRWRFEGYRLAHSGDVVVVNTFNTVSALDANTGEVRWRQDISARNAEPVEPVIRDEAVYLAAEDQFYALSIQTGEVLWTFAAPFPEESVPHRRPKPIIMVRDGVYWYRVRHLYALSRGDGRLKWQFDLGAPVRQDSFEKPPALIVRDAIGYVVMTDVLAAIHTETGEIIWKTRIPGLRDYSPIALGDRFICATSDSGIYALSTDTGEIRWQKQNPAGGGSMPRLAVKDGILYTALGGGLVALEIDAGQQKWEFHEGLGRNLRIEGLLINGDVYFSTLGWSGGNHSLYGLTREGKFRWKYQPAANTVRPLTVVDQILYASSDDILYAFDLAKIDQLLTAGKRWWSDDISGRTGPNAFLESRNEVADNEVPDLEVLGKIVLPENPTKAQVRDYVSQILSASKNQQSYLSPWVYMPVVYMLAQVGPEHVDVLIAARGESLYITGAIRQLAGEAHKEMILAALWHNHSLVKVVVNKGWVADAKHILVDELRAHPRYLPVEWIYAVAFLADPNTYHDLKAYLINGFNRGSTYRSIKDLPGIDLTETVAKAWEQAKSSNDEWDVADMAPVAIEFGHLDALEFVINALDKDPDTPGSVHEARKVVQRHTDVRGTNKEIQGWFYGNKDKLVFDPKTQKFRVQR